MLGDIASAKFAPAKSHYLLFAHNKEEISNQKRLMIETQNIAIYYKDASFKI